MRFFFYLFLFLLAACEKQPSLTTYKRNFFDIHFHMIVGETLTSSQKEKIETILNETFEEVDRVYNNWNPQSELSLLNQLPAGKSTRLSPRLLDLLTQAARIVTLSEGRFDPTIEPLQQLWKKKLREGVLPSPLEIDPLLPAIGWSNIHMEDEMFWKDHSFTALDLGGISKGYVVDLLTERLQKEGLKNLYIEWGGEIRAAGRHPEGRPWRIGVAAVGTIELKDGALATSGDYYQCWEVQNETYFHIIDPHTKSPLKKRPGSISTVSVLAPNCTLADGVATTLMLFASSEEAAEWACQLENVQCWIGSQKVN